MRKSTKICLIITAVLAVVGIAFCIAGAACGVSLSELRNIPFYRERIREYEASDTDDFEFSQDFDGIKKLELEIDVTEMTITESGDESFHVYGSHLGESFECRQDGKTLKLKSERKLFLPGGREETITIEVPKGTIFQEVEMRVGVGSLEAERLDCKELKLECGVGSVSVNGQIREDGEIDCGVGEVILALDNKEEDFDYKVSCGIGSVLVGENSYSGIPGEKEIDNGAKHKMEIECGIGSVAVTFDGE
ncbi:DUF4097 family beta strand repeat-containing protein [Lachnospiraceae bacterium 46-15]